MTLQSLESELLAYFSKWLVYVFYTYEKASQLL